MNTPEVEALAEDIQQLIEKTKAGKANWLKSNPTTFTWDTGPSPFARLSLQRIDQVKVAPVPGGGLQRTVVNNYVFQAVQLPMRAVKLAINTSDPKYAALHEPLQTLFEVISGGTEKEGLDFLRQIIKHE